MVEKAPGSGPKTPSKPKKPKGTYGDIFKKSNEGPFDPVDPKYYLDKPEGEKTVPKAPNAAEVAKKIAPKHEAMRTGAAQEAREEQERERQVNMEELVTLLNNESVDAEQKGNKILSKQLEDASRALAKKVEKDESVRIIHALSQKYSDSELGEMAKVIVAEGRRREGERDGGAQPIPLEKNLSEETAAGFSDERLEAFVQGLTEEARERREKREAAQKELGAQVDADLATAAGEPVDTTEVEALLKELAAQEKAKTAAKHERLAIEMEDSVRRAAMQNTSLAREGKRLENDIKKAALENGSRAKKGGPDEPEGGIETWSPEDWERDKAEAEAGKRKRNGPLEETPPEAWEEHYKEAAAAKKNAENYGYTVSMEKLSSAVKEVALERGKIIDEKTPEQHKGFMRRIAEKYRAVPRWQRIALSGLLLSGVVATSLAGGPASVITGFWIGQRIVSGLGAWAVTDALTERWKKRYVAGIVSGGVGVAAAFGLPSFVQYLDHSWIGDSVRDLMGFPKGGSGGGKLDGLLSGKPAPGNVGLEHAVSGGAGIEQVAPGVGGGLEHLFDQPVIVDPDDSAAGLWGIIQDKLTDAKIINENTPQATINRMISYLENNLRDLGTDGIKKLGFVSGEIGKIYPGDKLDLSILDKEGWIKHLRVFR